MHLDRELLLAVGIVAFYLIDSARLLHFDELLVAPARRGWQVSVPTGIESNGRFLLLPNPLAPFATLLRASWLHPGGAPGDDASSLHDFTRPLWPVRIGCTLVGLLVALAIPALLLTSRDPVWLLAALAACQATTLAMLVVVFRQRARLGLDRRRYAALALESLLCPPCATNLYRKLCALRGFVGDPVDFAAAHMTGQDRQRLLAAIEARIDLFAMADDDADGPVSGLRSARTRIARRLCPEHAP